MRLDPVLARAWAGRDPFEAARAQPGVLAKSKDGRRTLRFELDGRGAYLKYHPGVGRREIVKNLVQLRLPVVDAGQEYRAAQHLGAPLGAALARERRLLEAVARRCDALHARARAC